MSSNPTRECSKPGEVQHYTCTHATLSQLPAIRGCDGCWMHTQLNQTAVEPSIGISPNPDPDLRSMDFTDLTEKKD